MWKRIKPCWSCNSEGPCYKECKCLKCVDPKAYVKWRCQNPDQYKKWLEDLTDIRSTTELTAGRENRDRQAKWTFGEIRDILEYQTKIMGVPLRTVDAENTSIKCPRCGLIDKKNRKSRDMFECIKCYYTEIADLVGAINISRRAAAAGVNQPIVSSVFTTDTSYPALAGSS
jgi:IS605 OrfB family transposase